MDKKEYIKRIDEIKASDELKNRIIEGVNKGKKPSNKKNSYIMIKTAGAVAAASVAVVAAILIGGQSDTSKPAKEVTTKNDVDTKETTKKEMNAIENEEFKQQMYSEVTEFDLVSDDKKIKVNITNNSPYKVYIDPEYSIEYEEGIAEKGMSYAVYNPKKVLTYGKDMYLEPGESIVYDISDSFLDGYLELIKNHHDIIVNINAYTTDEVEAGNKYKTTMTAGFAITTVAVSRVQSFVPVDSKEMAVYFANKVENYNDVHYEAKFYKKNMETFEWDPYNTKDGKQLATEFDMTYTKLVEERTTLPLGDGLEPGVYMVILSCELDGLGVFEESRTFSTVGGEDVALATDKEKYTMADDKINLIFSDAGVKEYESALCRVYKLRDMENGIEIVDSGDEYIQLDLNVDEIDGKIFVPIDKPEGLEASKYAVVVELVGGDEVSYGAGIVTLTPNAYNPKVEYTMKNLYATFEIEG